MAGAETTDPRLLLAGEIGPTENMGIYRRIAQARQPSQPLTVPSPHQNHLRSSYLWGRIFVLGVFNSRDDWKFVKRIDPDRPKRGRLAWAVTVNRELKRLL